MEDVTLLAPTWEKEKSMEETGQETNKNEEEAVAREDDASEKDEL